MRQFLFFFVFVHLFAGILSAQLPADTTVLYARDSVIGKDTMAVNNNLVPLVDTAVSRMPRRDSVTKWNASLIFTPQHLQWRLMKQHPYFGFSGTPATLPTVARQVKGKELLFYLFVVLLMGYALLKKLFPKYFNDLFRLFFRTTLKQRQIKEQLMQTPLPSMLLNGFFVISGGLYISFLLQHFSLEIAGGFWFAFLYSCLGLSAVYLVKFAGLKIAGWLFSMPEAAGNYIFIVFVVNKMIGLLLLPLLGLLAFAAGPVYELAIALSLCLVGGLFAYRIILTFAAVRNQVKVNPFHFFLYLCAFEIAPLLILYKGLLLYFGITA